MEIKKLSLVNISVLIILVAVSIFVWNVSRNIGSNETIFQASNELVIYPEKAVAKVEAFPLPKAAVAPLSIVPPKVLFQILPEFPTSVKAGGSLILRALVSSSGNVDRVEIRSSSGNELLDKSAASAVSAWKFSPARRGVAAIASWFEVPVRFEVDNR
jgi:TonB family protein